MNQYEQEGYDAYIRVLLAHGNPRPQDAVMNCPYWVGNKNREYWMQGWITARSEA